VYFFFLPFPEVVLFQFVRDVNHPKRKENSAGGRPRFSFVRRRILADVCGRGFHRAKNQSFIMADQRTERPLLSENEVEFLALEELVTISPLFKCAKLSCMMVHACFAIPPDLTEVETFPFAKRPDSTTGCFLQADYGPFQPRIPIDVPLWLAIKLKSNKRCSIHPPPWMSVGMCY
jgi:hypothetical protein